MSRLGGIGHFDISFPLISLSKIFSTRLEIIFLLAPVKPNFARKQPNFGLENTHYATAYETCIINLEVNARKI